MADSNYSNLRKLIKLDAYFRSTKSEKCTMQHIIDDLADDPDFGKRMSRSSFYDHLNNFRTMGAEFKGHYSEKTGNFIFAKAEDGKTAIFQYADPKQAIPALEQAMGEAQIDSGRELLSLLERNCSDENSVLVWLKLYLAKMIKSESDSPLEVVSFYENSDSNLENIRKFETLLQAILNKQPLEITCPNAKRPVAHVQPCLLKNYNQRWYLIGKVRNHRPRPEHTGDYYEGYSPIALNQISDIRPWEEEEWIEPDWEELREYYDEIIGVTQSKEGPQDVYLRFDPVRYDKYVATKPMARTQRLVREGAEHYDPERPTIRLSVHVTKELTQQILSFGPDCEVIAPATLREEIQSKIREMLSRY